MKKKQRILILSFIFLSLFLYACSISDLEHVLNNSNTNLTEEKIPENDNEINADINNNSPNDIDGEDLLQIRYIDVGQGDCIFIILPNGKSLLIDTGVSSSFDIISKFLDSTYTSKIDVLIGTHPHADHIGAMSEVIKNYEIGSIYMPKATSTSKTFENLLQTISDSGLKIKNATAGVTIDLDDSVSIEIIAPNSTSYDDTNNYSAIIKLSYENTSFLFTGDAESVSEKELLQTGYDLNADVLKVGHHGSQSSTSASFIKAVEPTYAIISVGKDNSYSHPSQKTLDRLSDYGVTVYRTDIFGTIVVTSDGDKISISAVTKDGE